ncbi:MAG: low specificity L-threonine aldolase [Marinifilaceae bacterium]
MKKKSFASDNYAGAMPEILRAVVDANTMHARAYGYDEYTQQAKEVFKKAFDCDLDVNFVFNGTGANVLGLGSVLESYNSVLCADTAHIYVDESTAPETFTGCRLVPLKTNSDGKIELATIKKAIIRRDDEHHPQIKALTLTQPTEYGTVYSLEELRTIGSFLKENDIIFHIDGARLFNAIENLQCTLKEMTHDVMVDILSVGGTKIGLLFGEAVVHFNRKYINSFKFKHKQSMQLSSKTRFISVQFQCLLEKELWRRSAAHSNRMALKLYDGVKNLSNIKITKPVQANSVFAIIPEEWNEILQAQTPFYIWDEDLNEVRWMCAFDTTEEEVEAFIKRIEELNRKI